MWLVTAAAAAVVVLTPLPVPSAAPVERRVRVEASMTGFTPSEIRVNPGDRVTLDLVSTDVVHGLYIDGYEISVTADPGETSSVTFVADRSGSFRFRCSVTCGTLHPFLIGKLQVGGNGLLWRAAGIAVLLAGAVLWGARR